VVPPAYVPAYAPPAYPGVPLPPSEPNPSNQAFQLPQQTTHSDPIRKRSERKFPIGLLLVGFGSLFVVAILGYAAYRVFLESEPVAPEPFTNTQGLKLVKIEGGTFRMGSSDNEPGRRPDEGPVREVTIRGPFFMSATEVTNGQYLRLIGGNPSRSSKLVYRPENLPVESVTWEEANEFCRKLTEKEKSQPWMRKGWEYRLPTEAEWEFACRGGTDTSTVFGDRLVFSTQGVFRPTGSDPLEASIDGVKPLSFAQEAGKTEANKFGLYDMHGSRDNPTGPTDGDKRVIRGGSFRDPASAARSAAREGQRPNDRRDTVGFRVVYAPSQK
jgi:formylglycine-generating enzyme required for sulfatase activity